MRMVCRVVFLSFVWFVVSRDPLNGDEQIEVVKFDPSIFDSLWWQVARLTFKWDKRYNFCTEVTSGTKFRYPSIISLDMSHFCGTLSRQFMSNV